MTCYTCNQGDNDIYILNVLKSVKSARPLSEGLRAQGCKDAVAIADSTDRSAATAAILFFYDKLLDGAPLYCVIVSNPAPY